MKNYAHAPVRRRAAVLTTEDQETLITIVAELVPPLVVQKSVQDEGVVPDFELLVKSAPSQPDARKRFIAAKVVKAYSDLDQIDHFAMLMQQSLQHNDELATRIAPFLRGSKYRADFDSDAAKEASLALTANFMSAPRLREFLSVTEGQICALISKVRVPGGFSYKCGTGFLVGADLVLTAYHNVKEHIDIKTGDRVPGSHVEIFACFDFFEGNPIAWPSKPDPPALEIAFHADWLVASSLDLPNDGLLDAVTEAAKAADIAKALDFALVKLAEPIGQRARQASGGHRRGWVDLMTWQKALQDDERIIIPQHPEGRPQSIDFGRFSQLYSDSDQSRTRLRYNTESRGGTSGAPCFTVIESRFHAVGVHNATFKPNGKKSVANQAVDLRSIAPCIQKHLSTVTALLAPTRIWNTGTLDRPQAVLGRTTFLDWILRAANDGVAERKDRLYCARGLTRRSGRTFSLEILRAALRQKNTDLVVELGTPLEAIPTTVPDFLRAIVYQIGLSPGVLSSLPPRPDVTLNAAGDKLRRWASEDVPREFNRILEQQRVSKVDRREKARQARTALQQANLSVPPDVDELANSPREVRDLVLWSRIWIVLDNLQEVALPEEIGDLIAGLTGAGASETGMPPELKRLRWIFLGDSQTRNFGDDADITSEELDPATIGQPEMLEAWREFGSSIQLSDTAVLEVLFEMLLDMAMQTYEADLAQPLTRLFTFQSLFRKVGSNVSSKVRRVS